MPIVEFTSHLHQFFPCLRGGDLSVEAATVAQVVAAVERVAPGFAFYVCDEAGRVRQHVNMWIDGKPIADRGTLTDAVMPDSRVLILQALSGG